LIKEEVVDDVKQLGGWLELYLALIKEYANGSAYSEGAMDTLISINTLYKMVFARVLEEKES